jgi:hypothetical protein
MPVMATVTEAHEYTGFEPIRGSKLYQALRGELRKADLSCRTVVRDLLTISNIPIGRIVVALTPHIVGWLQFDHWSI